jgi:hypothetical protein
MHDLVQLLERCLELDPGQMRAEAAVDADAEGEAPFGSAIISGSLTRRSRSSGCWAMK